MKHNIIIYNVKQVAEIFKMPEYTIREWAKNGQIPAKKIGKSWYFEESVVLDTFSASKATAENQPELSEEELNKLKGGEQ